MTTCNIITGPGSGDLYCTTHSVRADGTMLCRAVADPMQCWRLVETVGEAPTDSHYKPGAIARFSNGNPSEAIWNAETGDWVPLRWEKCADPRAVEVGA